MTYEQRQRASLAVRARMNERRLTVATLADQAGVDQKTIRAFLAGDRWPRAASRQQMARALGWPPGEIARRAGSRPELEAFSTLELLDEIRWRVTDGHLIVRS